jgi:tetratricopeptide (TPR) repeat protein
MRIVLEHTVLKAAAVFVLLTACALAPARASNEDGGTASPFGLGAGGRSISMGGAAAAVWEDSYALLWNPAGLFRVDRSEASVFHTSLFDEHTTYSSVLLAYPFVDFGVISVGAVQLRIGGIERRDAENRMYGSELENIQTRYMLGYAKNIFKSLSGGVSLKLDRYVQGAYVANGFGLDAGLGLTSPVRSPMLDGIALGVSLSNVLEPKINLVSEETGDPMGVRFGFAFWRSISKRVDDRLLLAVDIDKKRYADTHIHVGGEYRLLQDYSVRGGWDDGIPTFGCGFNFHHLQFDYAYRSTDLGGNHLFSLTYRFGASRNEKLERRRQQREREIQDELDAHIKQYEGRFVVTSLASGNEKLEAADFAGAIDDFRKVLLMSPGNEEAKRGTAVARSRLLMLDGDSLMQRERFAEALHAYRGAYAELPEREIEERIQQCERKIGEAQDVQRMVENFFSYALELFTDHRWLEAANAFEKVLEIEPGNQLASGYLLKSRTRMKEDFEESIALIDRLVTEKRYGAAADAVRRALEKHPDDGKLNERLTLIAKLQREAETSRQKIETARKSTASLSREEIEELVPMYEKGVEYFKRGDFTNAIGQWRDVWTKYPLFENVEDYLVRAYQYKGMELYSRHQYKEALDVWEKVLDVDPDNEKALRFISRTREELARLKGLTG